MQINSINYNAYAYSIGTSKSQEKIHTTTNKTQNVGSGSNKSSEEIWSELGSKYDIHNATFDELCEISSNLLSEGKISPLDYGTLTLVPKILDQAAENSAAKKYVFCTSVNSEGRRDWIAELEAQGSQQLRFGNMNGYVQYQNLAKLLKKLDS